MEQSTDSLLKDVIGPELYSKLENTPQSAKWHPEGNAKNHTILVMENVLEWPFATEEEEQTMMACAIFHDLGKIDTTKVCPDGKITSYGHEEASLRYLKELDESLAVHFPQVDPNEVKEIVANHMRAHLYNNGNMSNPQKRKAFKEKKSFPQIMLFAEFDSNGKG